MIGEDDGSGTVDCLRGRLLAERGASRAAKEEAKLMEEKVVELERELKREIGSKKRAEKKLKFVTKKLESLKHSSTLGQLNLSETKGSISSKEKKTDLHTAEPKKCKTERKMGEIKEELITEDFILDHSSTIAADSVHQMPSYKESSSSVDTAHYCKNEESSKFKDNLSSEEFLNYSPRQSSVHREELEHAQDQMGSGQAQDQMKSGQEQYQMEYVENPLALVSASIWTEPKACEQQSNNNIHEVLVALRHAKEILQSSMGRRATICSYSFELYGV
ncbi:uncharacterized protein LOC143892463 isoform X2 [Tasmannia lanceolata]|uniref:uncharacterized protein LOC143892463 isoform X2 n=1 Tax=Tasmannia lanceolata TaxID=3420 RepID=UPI0040642A08